MFRYALIILFQENRILIRPSILYRILVAVMAGFLTITMIVNGFSLPLLFLILICILSALYEEKWYFELSNRNVVYRNGLIFLAFTRKIPFDEIQMLETEVFVRGKISTSPIPDGRLPIGQIRNRRYLLILKDEKILTVEIRKDTENDSFLTNFRKLSQMCGWELIEK